MNQIVLNSFRSLGLFFVFCLILTAAPTGNIYAENNSEFSESAESNKNLRIVNDGTCPVRIYHWVPSGDIFKTIIQAGGHWDVRNLAGQKYRAINVNQDWDNLEYDEHYMLNNNLNQTWTITPDYCTDCTGEITGFLLNKQDGSALTTLNDGMSLCAADFQGHVKIRASESGSHESLKFTVTTPDGTWTKLENYVTYDTKEFALTPGEYTVKAELFRADNLGGTKCDEKEFKFTVTDCTIPVCNLTADLGTDQEICTSGLTLNPTTDGASTCNTNTGTSVVENTQSCYAGPQNHGCPDNGYAMFLNNETSDNPQYLKNVSLEWIQLPNGTATLKGEVENCANGDRCYVDVVFSGYTTTPDEDPKENNCQTEDKSDWYYYTSFTGTLTETESGNVTNLSRRGPGFQAGSGANVTESRPGQFGGCAWFDTDDATFVKGDFNLSFGPLTGGNTNNTVSFLWNTGATTASIDVVDAGEYCVTVTDCNGCTAEDCVNVSATNPEGGSLAFADGSLEKTICIDNTADPLNVSLTGNTGANQAWVITDTDLNILGLPAAPPFDLNGAGTGTCLIWSVSFEDLQGATVGANARDLTGCFELSNSITVYRNAVEGGEIAFMDGNGTPTEVTICVDDTPDPLNVSLTGNTGSNQAWVITDEDLNILGLPAAPPFDLNGAGIGTCLIWSVSFEDLQGATVGSNARDLTGCFELSNSLTVIREQCVFPVKIGNKVFNDLNRDGIQDSDEPGVAGVTVVLFSPGDDGEFHTADDVTSATAETNNNGRYLFEDVAPGTYCIQFIEATIPAGFVFSPQNTTNDGRDSDADATGKTEAFDVVSGVDDLTFDAGINEPVIIPNISVDDIVVNEDVGNAVLKICLDQVSNVDVSVDYSTSNDSALEGEDYTALAGSVTIPAGERCAMVMIPITEDDNDENDEIFNLNLSNPTNGVITDELGTVTILDNDEPIIPNITIDDVVVNEDAGTAVLKICLDQITTADITVDYKTSDDSALEGVDYAGVSGTVTIEAGESCAMVMIPIIEDDNDENDEVFNLDLTNPTGALTPDPQGTVTILDNDEPIIPNITIDDVVVNEDEGTAVLKICLDQITTADVTVDYKTSDNSALEGVDYAGVSGTVTIEAGESCAMVMIPIIEDDNDENDEVFNLDLTNPTGALTPDPQGTVTILDNDEPIIPNITIDDVVVNEDAGTAVLKICLDQITTADVTVDYKTSDDSALEGVDYAGVSGTVTIEAGESCAMVMIPIIEDDNDENDEVFNLDLTNPTGALTPDPQGTVTILDNDDSNIRMTCQDDINVELVLGQAGYTVTYDAPVPTTTCPGGNTDLTFVGIASGETVFETFSDAVTFTATDDCGNTTACAFRINITALPSTTTIDCLDDIFVNTNPTQQTATVTWTAPTATTDCPDGILEVIQEAGQLTPGSEFPLGMTNISYRASDNCGDLATCLFTVTVLETFQCPDIGLNIGEACDDGDATTENDTITDDCECTGTPIVVYDCPTLAANIGDSCDDNDATTENDAIDADCECAGTPIVVYDCPTLAANIGDTCDDNDATTENDAINADCECTGTPIVVYDCPTLAANTGDSCDDNDATTENDAIDADCECAGTPIVVYDCPTLTANIGDTCDDNDATTENDAINADCECAGTPIQTGCDVVYSVNGRTITIDNMNAPIATIKVIDMNWETIFSCMDWTTVCQEVETITVPECGSYMIQIQTFADWNTPLCNIFETIVIDEDCGTSYDCTDLQANIGDTCDDNDATTENDAINADCECSGTPIVIVYDCPALAANIGDACDDNDATTENDAINADCECAGTPIVIVYDCPALAANIGDTCDDNDATTENDAINADCECAGTPIVIVYDCPALAANIGDACDDNDATTENDAINADCECSGTPIVIVYDCPALAANIGDACDDNDATTENDAIDADCECAGTPIVIVYDCPALAANIGDACDDNDATTENDAIDADCECAGTPIVIVYDCPALAANIGDACDDNNANTTNDVVTADCGCEGTQINPNTCEVTYTVSGKKIIIDGLTAPIQTVKVLDMNWNTIYSCMDWDTPCQENEEIVVPACGTYFVQVQTYLDWNTPICNIFEIVTIEDDCGTVYDCPALQANIGDACDDNNPNTENDVVLSDCSCFGTPINTFDCPTLFANYGDTCDDFNSNTENDVITTDCECKGTPIGLGDCEATYTVDGNTITVEKIVGAMATVKVLDLTFNEVFACSDWTTACSETEVITVPDCGTYFVQIQTYADWNTMICNIFETVTIDCGGQKDCPALDANYGDACDDGNALTENDVITSDCECSGTPVALYDCPALSANIGDACDDGNANTENDQIQNDCSCAGTPTNICDNVTTGGSIEGDETGCEGFDPAPILSSELPSGGSGAIEYIWLSSTTGCPNRLEQIIPGATESTYDPGVISQTTYFRRCARRAGCTENIDWLNGESNCVVKTVDVCKTVCETREVSDTKAVCGNGLHYGFYGQNLVQGTMANSRFSLDHADFIEYSDGTAKLTGTAVNCKDTTVKFELDVTFLGRTLVNNGTIESNCYHNEEADWYFYSTFYGTANGIDAVEGASFNLANDDQPFQIGTGANLQEEFNLGAAAWFNYTIISQPTNPNITLSPGAQTDFNFNLSGAAGEPCAPITTRTQLLGLDAALNHGVVDITWTNNTGDENDNFEIQRSEDGVNFETIQTRTTLGDGMKFYETKDANALEGANFYRVKLNYLNGNADYSETRRVHISDVQEFGLFPNPAQETINVSLRGYEGKDIEIQLVDQFGKQVKAVSLDFVSDATYSIELNGVNNGVYSLWIFAEGSKPVGKKMIVNKMY